MNSPYFSCAQVETFSLCYVTVSSVFEALGVLHCKCRPFMTAALGTRGERRFINSLTDSPN